MYRSCFVIAFCSPVFVYRERSVVVGRSIMRGRFLPTRTTKRARRKPAQAWSEIAALFSRTTQFKRELRRALAVERDARKKKKMKKGGFFSASSSRKGFEGRGGKGKGRDKNGHAALQALPKEEYRKKKERGRRKPQKKKKKKVVFGWGRVKAWKRKNQKESVGEDVNCALGTKPRERERERNGRNEVGEGKEGRENRERVKRTSWRSFFRPTSRGKRKLNAVKKLTHGNQANMPKYNGIFPEREGGTRHFPTHFYLCFSFALVRAYSLRTACVCGGGKKGGGGTWQGKQQQRGQEFTAGTLTFVRTNTHRTTSKNTRTHTYAHGRAHWALGNI